MEEYNYVVKKQEYLRMHQVQENHWWYVTRRNFIQTVLVAIQDTQKKRILDIGCGTGANTNTLRLFGNVIGMDTSPYAKKFYTTDGHTSFVLGSAENIPFTNETFDLVVMTDVLYHKNITNPLRVLDEVYRVLKPQGYCLITDCVHPFLFGPHDVQNQARERFTKKRLEQLVANAGYVTVRSSYMFMSTFPVFVFARLFAKWFHPQVSVEETMNRYINAVFHLLGKLDTSVFKRHNLPFGSSVIILGKKCDTGVKKDMYIKKSR